MDRMFKPFEEKKESESESEGENSDDYDDVEEKEDVTLRIGYDPKAAKKPSRKGSIYSSYQKIDRGEMRKL